MEVDDYSIFVQCLEKWPVGFTRFQWTAYEPQDRRVGVRRWTNDLLSLVPRDGDEEMQVQIRDRRLKQGREKEVRRAEKLRQAEEEDREKEMRRREQVRCAEEVRYQEKARRAAEAERVRAERVRLRDAEVRHHEYLRYAGIRWRAHPVEEGVLA